MVCCELARDSLLGALDDLDAVETSDEHDGGRGLMQAELRYRSVDLGITDQAVATTFV